MEYIIFIDEKERDLLRRFLKSFTTSFVRVYEVGKNDGKYKFMIFGTLTEIFKFFKKYGRWSIAVELEELSISSKVKEIL
jgi:hypothetical protein